MFESYSISALVAGAVVLIGISSLLQRVFYNLYLHPLAHIPGPKIAAATYLYQTYYSLVGGSRYYIQIEKLHHEYGKATMMIMGE